MKSILIIGGGEIGLNQIIWAREAGFHVIVSDRNPNAAGLKLADIGVIIDGTDARTLVTFALANKKKYNICAVYCGNDFGLFSRVAIAQALHLPDISIEAVARSLDKGLMKECWLRDGIPTPRMVEIDSPKQAEAALAQIGLPAIIKPTGASGAQGVQRIETEAELSSALVEAFRYSSANRVLVEQCIEGSYHDVNGLLWDGRFYPCGTADHFVSPLPYRVPVGHYDPSQLQLEVQKRLYTILERAVRSIGVDFGPVKGDFVIFNDSIYLYEVSARFHGDGFTARSVQHAPGANLIKTYMQALYNRKLDIGKLKPRKNAVVSSHWVISLPLGRVKKIIGLSEAKRLKGVNEILLYIREGDEIRELKSTTDIPGFVWITAHSRNETDRIYSEFCDLLKVEYY